MKAYFTQPIKSKDDAYRFFDQLYRDGLLFHPEDSPDSIVGPDSMPLFTTEECIHLTYRIAEVYQFDLDPCAYCLGLSGSAEGADDRNKPLAPHTTPCSICEGILTMEDGTTIDLLKIQAACNSAFQQLGDPEFAEAANELAKLTGKSQGPHGEWLDNED
jgi:hypothetical protein